MIIEIEDNLSYRGALLSFKYYWTKAQLENGTVTSAAKRLGISRKGLQLLNKISPDDYNKMKAPKYTCVFCGKSFDIRLHHMDGKRHSDETEAICERCHEVFHIMNKRYKL